MYGKAALSLFLAFILSLQLLFCNSAASPRVKAAEAVDGWRVYYECNDESAYRFNVSKHVSGLEIWLYISTDDSSAEQDWRVFNDDWIELTLVSNPILVATAEGQYVVEPIVGLTKIGHKGDGEKSVGGAHGIYYALPKSSFVSYVNVTLHVVSSNPRLDVSRSFTREWDPFMDIVQLEVWSKGWYTYKVSEDCKGRMSLISFGTPIGDQPMSSGLTWCFGKRIRPPSVAWKPDVYIEVGYAGGINIAPELFAGQGNYKCKINVGIGAGETLNEAVAFGLQETVYMVEKGDKPELVAEEAASGCIDILLEILGEISESPASKKAFETLGYIFFVLDLVDLISTLGFDHTVAESKILVFKDVSVGESFIAYFNSYAEIASAGLSGAIVNFWGECPFGSSVFDNLGFSVTNLPDGGMQIGGILLDYHSLFFPEEVTPITIREDGFVEPPTPIVSFEYPGKYRLTDDFNGTIVIFRSYVVLDGGFHTVRGVEVYNDRVNVTIEKLRIIGGSAGIISNSPYNLTVRHSIIAENQIGIKVGAPYKPSWYPDAQPYSVFIYDNNFTRNGIGVEIAQVDFHESWDYSGSYVVSRNNFTLNGCGVSGATGSYTITENYFKDNENALNVSGTSATISMNTIMDCASGINADVKLLVACEDNYVANAYTCVEIRAVYNGTISRNKLFNCKNGIVSTFGGHLNITENKVLNCDYAVFVRQGATNIIGNEISARICGICLPTQPHMEPPYWGVGGWRIINNTVHGAEYGIYAGGNLFDGEIHACCITNCKYGVYVNQTQGLLIHENSLLGNVYGVYVTDCHNYLGRIIGNSFLYNNVTIWFEDTFYFKSWDCYHNNFMGGKVECLRYEPYYEDFWDDGYPSGGNYWSNYDGEDRKSGSEQNLEGGDGIGDTPYQINVAFVDRYPLMEPYGELRPTVYIHQLADGTILRLTSNSAISNFTCDTAAKKIKFEVYWKSGTKGFATVEVPKNVFKGEPEVYFDGKTMPFNKSEVGGLTRISFLYKHSKHYLEIRFSGGEGKPPPPSSSPQPFEGGAQSLTMVIIIIVIASLTALLFALYLRKASFSKAKNVGVSKTLG